MEQRKVLNFGAVTDDCTWYQPFCSPSRPRVGEAVLKRRRRSRRGRKGGPCASGSSGGGGGERTHAFPTAANASVSNTSFQVAPVSPEPQSDNGKLRGFFFFFAALI